MRRVETFDVETRIGLRITQRLGLRQHRIKAQALVTHFAQDEIGRAVDDAGHPLDPVA